MDDDTYIGEIRMFIGTYAPAGWFLCQGQVLQIRDYTALFAILGFQYGGDGNTTFALPDFRGRVPLGAGSQAPTGLTPRRIGATAGEEAVTLVMSEMPSHTHTATFGATAGVRAGTNQGSLTTPQSGSALAEAVFQGSTQHRVENYAGNPNNPNLVALGGTQSSATLSVALAGGGMPHDNMQPWLAINYMIAWEGMFPQKP